MLWPITAGRDEYGELTIGGVRVRAIAEQTGTPVYIYDEATIRERCRRFRTSLESAYPRAQVKYAAKAWLSHALIQILVEEGFGLDVVSGGELYVALKYGMPPDRIAFHGNNKSREELEMALDAGVAYIVVDNHDEINLLLELAIARDAVVPVLVRVNPGIDAHTHEYRKTGVVDSKFGLGITTGDAERAVRRILDSAPLQLLGYHAHVGSQIYEVESFTQTVNVLLAFAAGMRDRYGFAPEIVSPGGGFGIPYEMSDPDIEVDDYVSAVAEAAKEAARKYELAEPLLTIEPGRAIVGPAGIAVYTVGSSKEIPGVRTYVSVDGGMADNIRPALYDAVYSAALVSNPDGQPLKPVTIAGKFCESGDVLIKQVDLPPLKPGQLLAVPAAGAYCLAMASNYNLSLRPPVVFVNDGRARIIQRRENFEDLVARDMLENQYLGL